MTAAKGSAKDTGFAWVVCALCFLIQVIIGGFIYTPGMFYIMFKEGLDASDSALSFITSLNVCIIFFLCPFMGLLTDRYGERLISSIGVGLSTIALACCSFSTQVYHLHILYGVMAGIGMGMTYSSSIGIIPKYFNKYMRFATCISLSGTGVGTFVLPPILNALELKYGWRGAMLLMAGVNVQTLICCCFFRPLQVNCNDIITVNETANDVIIKAEIEQESCEIKIHVGDSKMDVLSLTNGELHLETGRNDGNSGCNHVKTDKEQDNQRNEIGRKRLKEHNLNVLVVFKTIPFLCVLGLEVFISFPIGIVATHFGSYVLTLGYSKSDVVQLYMVWGISSAIGRLLVGVVAQVTNTNIGVLMLVACGLNGVLTMLVPYIEHLWLLYIFVIFHQLFVAVYGVLNIPYIVESVLPQQSSFAIGLGMMFCIPGMAVGPPLAAWLYECTWGYSSLFYLSAALLTMAGLTMIVPAFKTHRQQILKLDTKIEAFEFKDKL